MLKELYTAAMGLVTQETRLETIANNMANSNTTGFKREAVFERNLQDARAVFYNVPIQAEQDDPPHGAYTDFSQGGFQQTDNRLDIAIENKDGFFLLQDEAGNQYLTKSGNFTLSEDGTIKAMDGKTLIGENGQINLYSELKFSPEEYNARKSVDLKIAEDGEVFANEKQIGRLQLVRVDNTAVLERVSGSNFIVTDNAPVSFIPMQETSIRQGWLEKSNVDIIKEMISLIELQRNFEAGSKVIHTNDSTIETTLKTGKFQ